MSVGVQHAPEFTAALHVVTEYLSLSLGSRPKDFTPDTPFMDAGLDSLDLLKVPAYSKRAPHGLQGSALPSLHASVWPCISPSSMACAMVVVSGVRVRFELACM